LSCLHPDQHREESGPIHRDIIALQNAIVAAFASAAIWPSSFGGDFSGA
jgi:hypothetical protein